MTWIINNNVATEELRLQKNMVALSRIPAKPYFSSHYFCQGVVHYMLIVLQRHYFIKWDKRKVPGFKESYCYSSVLSYFACGKTRLRCRRLVLSNRYIKMYNYLEVFSVGNIRLLMIPVWSKRNFPKSENMMRYYLKLLIRFYPRWELRTLPRQTWEKNA